MKAVYEVKMEVPKELADEHLIWLRKHVSAIVKETSFERAELFTLESDSPAHLVRVVQYIAPSRKAVEEYLSVHAPRFRADTASNYGQTVKLERRILNFQEAFPA